MNISDLIKNDETDVNANLDVTYTPSNSYFDINVTNRTSGDLSITISGMSLASIAGILLNLFIPGEDEEVIARAPAPAAP